MVARSLVFPRLLIAARALASLLALVLLCAPSAQAQAPLFLVNEDTQVRSVGFEFAGTKTFEADRLQQQIVTQGAGTLDRIKAALPLLEPAPHPFAPVELQKDVVRLQQFYRLNGFLNAQIDYPASTLDTTSNKIRVVFTIDEGPPLIIQDVSFYGPDSARYAAEQFPAGLREDWIAFRDRTSFRLGERYTTFNRTRIEDEVLRWLENQGYAFARLGAEVDVDSTQNTADIRFYVDAGPLGHIADIEVEGSRAVNKKIVRRELPFEVGDPYSSDKLSEGQRQLFGLNLFRVALAEVPSQPRDSSVTVRYNVREAPLRYLTAQTGYGRVTGLNAQGQWTHRNFSGGARELTASVRAETGLGAVPGAQTLPSSLFRGSLSLRQPYLFTTRLSGLVSPFLQYEQNPFLREAPDRPFHINSREYGVNGTLIYELLPFRTVSLQQTFSRVTLLGDPALTAPDVPAGGESPATERLESLYNKSILTLNATLGQSDDYINPSRGYLGRPLAEFGGGPLGRGVQYFKLGTDLTGYLPLTGSVDVAGRLSVGRLFPYGDSKNQSNVDVEDRFDPIRFYAGGGSDVRGWGDRLAGDKFARPLTVQRTRGVDTDGDDVTDSTAVLTEITDYIYEAEGGLAKLAFNAELRLPFPGLGPSWGTAVFFDAGQVGDDLLALDNLRFGTGAGLRYQTPVGYLRLDVAYKLNPDREDLRDPEEVYKFNRPTLYPDQGPPEEKFIRRFRLHFSIGQAF